METQNQESSKKLKLPNLPEPPVIQLKSGNWIYKIAVTGYDRNVIDCAWYISNSGMTVEGCYQIEVENNGEISAKPARGLWVMDWKKMTLEADFKFTRDKLTFTEIFLQTYKDFLKRLSPRKYLVEFNNYGVKVYIAHKVKTIEANPVLTQGHLEIHEVEVPDYIEFYDYPLEIYNHYAEGVIKLAHAKDGTLVRVNSRLDIKSEDHDTITLGPGTYLLVHPPVRKAD
ncbi:hypothetical protein AFV8_gp14 [Betalipothrixvirus puteoliense]|uniref:Uncharacterized protein n=1 Tax=Betalipothrixvirus puteoliense TaxID=346884 RepID=A7WKU4_9VIRU|nr:hypothetical protein AFV8_gp14 [Acidianus filamentous virus 8]CAJ31691.1 conserved hypothetical protein [Acidianus filamentous virus 8]